VTKAKSIIYFIRQQHVPLANFCRDETN
jgi:hypothetical protein